MHLLLREAEFSSTEYLYVFCMLCLCNGDYEVETEFLSFVTCNSCSESRPLECATVRRWCSIVLLHIISQPHCSIQSPAFVICCYLKGRVSFKDAESSGVRGRNFHCVKVEFGARRSAFTLSYML